MTDVTDAATRSVLFIDGTHDSIAMLRDIVSRSPVQVDVTIVHRPHADAVMTEDVEAADIVFIGCDMS